jgi:PAS domain-containing protein
MCESYNTDVEHCNVSEASIATFGNVVRGYERTRDGFLSISGSIFQTSTTGKPMQYPHSAIAEIIGNGYFIVDQRWTVSSWSHIAEELLGISAADILGKNVWTQFRDAIPTTFYTTFYQAMLKDIPVHFTIYWPKMKAWFDVTTCHFDDLLSVSFKSSKHPEEPEPLL